jgi:hypothetical protein
MSLVPGCRCLEGYPHRVIAQMRMDPGGFILGYRCVPCMLQLLRSAPPLVALIEGIAMSTPDVKW